LNIFVLHLNPSVAAQMLCDKHVNSMVMETAQILSDVNGGPYKPVNPRHPCQLWAGTFSGNYQWLVEHGLAISNEYRFRYKREHGSEEVIQALKKPLRHLTEGLSPFVLCMPDQYKSACVVGSYRKYYKTEKQRFAVWNKSRPPPEWWNDVSNN
jgi:hypothetical protein